MSEAGQNQGMALIPCYECEKEISDQAAACPHLVPPSISRKLPWSSLCQRLRKEV
jgi:hypothetical protein